VATTILENFGYRYEVACNGKEALQKFASGKYSLILMDVEMPVMDGHETTRRIRALEHEKNLPHQIIIAMTAHAVRGEKEKCIDAGMDDYISKPFNLHGLQAMLSKNINNARAVA
jgi:CheY-like chemotaxis protein